MKKILSAKATSISAFCLLLLLLFLVFYYLNNRVLVDDIFCGEWRSDMQKILDNSALYQSSKDEEVKKRLIFICNNLHYKIHKNGVLECYSAIENKYVKYKWEVLKSTNKELIIKLKNKYYPWPLKIYFENQGNNYITVRSDPPKGLVEKRNVSKYPPTKIYLKRVIKQHMQ